MTRQEFETLAQNIIILDGATGSNLRKAGLPIGVCPEHWILEHPEPLIRLQQAYAEAGSQIIYAPTFSGNRIALTNYGLQDQLAELNTKLVALTRQAVGDKAYVAGDLTTTGRMLEPRGNISYQELYDVYKEQISALTDAGADLLAAETMLDVDETLVLLDAAQAVCDLPVMCSLTLEADGSALFGGNAVEMVEQLQDMGAAAVGLNCSVGPDQLEAVVAAMKSVARVPVIAKPNAGMPLIDDKGVAHYNMDAEHFGKSMKKLVERGAGVVGGCCGTDPTYIRALVREIGRR